MLFMTATPIPRTLAITVFGEMDVSIIDEMPAGGKPSKPIGLRKICSPGSLLLAFMEKELKAGRQAYVICPLIEESDNWTCRTPSMCTTSSVSISREDSHVGLMHGRLHPDKRRSHEEFQSE